MRIIAGEFRHRRIFSPPESTTTRPIPDRIKESVFSILRGHFDGAAVVDVFAGSGAIGLEAVSRGAANVVFIEKDRRAAEIIERNVAELGCTDRCEVVRADALGLSAVARAPRPVHLVFFDPPYPMCKDPAQWQRIRHQLSRFIDLLDETGYAVLRTPWPFRHVDNTGVPVDAREHAGHAPEGVEEFLTEEEALALADEDSEEPRVEDDVEEQERAVPTLPVDLRIDNALGPETHTYGSMAVHLYMKRPV